MSERKWNGCEACAHSHGRKLGDNCPIYTEAIIGVETPLMQYPRGKKCAAFQAMSCWNCGERVKNGQSSCVGKGACVFFDKWHPRHDGFNCPGYADVDTCRGHCIVFDHTCEEVREHFEQLIRERDDAIRNVLPPPPPVNVQTPACLLTNVHDLIETRNIDAAINAAKYWREKADAFERDLAPVKLELDAVSHERDALLKEKKELATRRWVSNRTIKDLKEPANNAGTK